jgi:hypothetical protein
VLGDNIYPVHGVFGMTLLLSNGNQMLWVLHGVYKKIKYMCVRTDLKKTKRLGIVHEPIFDSVEINNFIVPPLNLGLVLGNNILDRYYDCILHKVEMRTDTQREI